MGTWGDMKVVRILVLLAGVGRMSMRPSEHRVPDVDNLFSWLGYRGRPRDAVARGNRQDKTSLVVKRPYARAPKVRTYADCSRALSPNDVQTIGSRSRSAKPSQ